MSSPIFPLQQVIDKVYTAFTGMSLSLDGAPGKCIFLSRGLPMTDSLAGAMEEHVAERMAGRLGAFERFTAADLGMADERTGADC